MVCFGTFDDFYSVYKETLSLLFPKTMLNPSKSCMGSLRDPLTLTLRTLSQVDHIRQRRFYIISDTVDYEFQGVWVVFLGTTALESWYRQHARNSSEG